MVLVDANIHWQVKERPKSGGLESPTFLERWPIASGIERTPDLINNKETKFLRNLHVLGTFNARRGELTAASQELRRCTVAVDNDGPTTGSSRREFR